MNEALRQRVVRQFESLNLEYSKELQLMTSFAAKLCKTPISFITLQDNGVGLLKMYNSLNTELSPAELSLCKQAIKHNRIMVINDTHTDVRFTGNSHATNGMKIRFCAAAPLITQQEFSVGTLCVMDYKPHTLTNQEKLILKILAKHIVSVMELKLSLDQLDQNFTELKEERMNRINSELKLRSMFESLTDSYFLLAPNAEVIDFNRAASDIVRKKYNIKLDYGLILTDILEEDYRPTFSYHINLALKGNKTSIERHADFGKDGMIWWECTFEPVKNINGEIVGVSYIGRNINEAKLSEKKITEQNHMLTRIAEIQSHDYRGPVASILGLMNIIEADGYRASKEYLQMLHDAVQRLDEKIHDVVGIINQF